MKAARAGRRTRRTARTRDERGARGPLERDARRSLADAARSMRAIVTTAPAVAAAAEAVVACLENGGTVFFCGNGGSAADAQHLAAELAGRYLFDRPPLAAVALTTNSSSVTAIGNDYGFDVVFSRQLEALGSPGDVLVATTTSGRSPNVLAAVRTAHALGMSVIGFTGEAGAEFAAECDLALVTPSRSTPRIQEGHAVMGHALCQLVEEALFAAPRRGGAGVAGARGTRRTSRSGARGSRTS